MRRTLLFAALIVLHGVVCAQELKPYPHPRITEGQWTTYFDDVKAKQAASMQVLAEHRLVVFHDSQTATSYAFTQPGHPAHPAWVTRAMVRDGEQIRVLQVGYFAGDEPAFADLFKAYQLTNERMRQQAIEDMRRKKP